MVAQQKKSMIILKCSEFPRPGEQHPKGNESQLACFLNHAFILRLVLGPVSIEEEDIMFIFFHTCIKKIGARLKKLITSVHSILNTIGRTHVSIYGIKKPVFPIPATK